MLIMQKKIVVYGLVIVAILRGMALANLILHSVV